MTEERHEIENQINELKRVVDCLQQELNIITRDIKMSPNRNINTDQEAMAKNMEISKEIQKLLLLQKKLDQLDQLDQ